MAAGAVDRTYQMHILAVKDNKIALFHDLRFAVAAALGPSLDYINDLRLAVPLQLGFVGVGREVQVHDSRGNIFIIIHHVIFVIHFEIDSLRY